MKKLLVLLLMVVMSLTLMTGCGGDPVYDELENYMNVEMVEVNANYESIKAEVANWQNFTTDAELNASISDVLLPLIDDSLAKLDAMALETEEVNAIKDKYVAVMEAYQAGFSAILEGDVDTGNAKIEEGVALIDEYNTALEELAAEVGAEVTY